MSENTPHFLPIEEGRSHLEQAGVADIVTTCGNLRVSQGASEKQLVIEANEQAIAVESAAAHKDLRDTCGINPFTIAEYGDDTELLRSLVNHSLNKRKDKQIRMIHSNGKLVEILGGDVQWNKPLDVFDAVVKQSNNRITGVESIRRQKLKSIMRFSTDATVAPPREVGDITHTGIWVSTNGTMETGAFLFRLACRNGVLFNHQNVGRSMISENIQHLAQHINEQLAFASQAGEHFVSLATKPERRPTRFITGLAHGLGIGDRHTRALVEGLPELGDRPTRYDLINMITSRFHQKQDEKFAWIGGSACQTYQEEFRWEKVKIPENGGSEPEVNVAAATQ